MQVLILDFYVDEPACFGVPPYLSPYCRYAAGSLAAAGLPEKNIHYQTVDDYRKNGKTIADEYDLVIVIAGATVPGRYLGGKIGSVAEIIELLEFRKKYQKKSATLIGGPVKYADREIRNLMEEKGGILIRGDIELYAGLFIKERTSFSEGSFSLKEKRTYEQVDLWAKHGAFLTCLHPNFPHLILELETYRGCTRDVFCSFCSEAFYGRPSFRMLDGIFAEVEELYRMGNRYFRLGRQADLMSYLPHMNEIKNSFPRPNPENLAKLYAGIRKAAPDLRMLHLDNINPGVLSTYPDESEKIIQTICENNTAGDTAAMGLETVDENVILLNDLKSSEEESFRAIELVNKFGARRVGGIPVLLPGLNFIHGLAGETDSTFEKNYNFLKKIMESGLLLRRINIRQVSVHSKTKLERIISGDLRSEKSKILDSIPRKKRNPAILRKKFEYYRNKIRAEVDKPMLEKCFPAGTVLKDVILESKHDGYILGRPLGSYPVTVKIPPGDPGAENAYREKKPVNIIISGYFERSIMGISHPVRINILSEQALMHLPGIGKKRAVQVFNKMPHSYRDLSEIAEGNIFSENDFVWE